MTGRAADQMGLRDRGLIRVGHMADLVVFNPATIADTATYQRPLQYPTGIEHVIVNGVPVLDPGGLTGARPGRPLYGPARTTMTLRTAATVLIVAALLIAPRLALVDPLLAQGATGRVTGSVKLTMAAAAPSAASAYERRSVGPRPKPQAELRNVVIFFTDLAAIRSAPTPASISQRDEQFVPHLVAVTSGSSVAFPNEDPFFHNVFSLSRGASFNLGRYPSGASRSRTLSRSRASSRCSARSTRT